MSQGNQQQSPRVKIASLWEHQTQDGKRFFSGYLGDSMIEIWPNGYKNAPNQPDWNVFVKPKMKKQETKKTDYQQDQTFDQRGGDWGNEEIPF